MNHLLIGTADKTERLLSITKPRFLLIDDGPIADAFLAEFPKARLFDPAKHSFDPLKRMDYRRARDFAETVYSASPQGESTLTVRNGKRALARMLLTKGARLDKFKADSADPGMVEAVATIGDLLLSPVLRKVFCTFPTFSFEGSTVARLDRAQLGDFDAFVLASLLIGQHKGQVIVPDGGFYLRPLHLSLMRQGRLTAGLNVLNEVPRPLAQALLTIPDKFGAGCTHDDALVLASYAGLIPGHNAHNDFVQRTIEAAD